MQSTAVSIFIIHTTRNTVWAGVLTMAAWLPAIVGSPLGGVVSERWSRQRWIQLNNVVMALCASGLAVAQLTGHLTPWLIAVLALIEGTASSASWAGWQSLLQDLVDRDEVLAAVSLSSAGFNLGRFFGPAIAASALAVGSYTTCFVANALSFIGVIVAFQFVRARPRALVKKPFDFFGDLSEGARAAWASEPCRHAIISVGVIAFVLSPFISFVAAMSQLVLGEGKSGTAWLIAAQGAGAVVGAFLAPSLARRSSRLTVLRWSMAILVVGVLIYGLGINYPVALVALFVVGGAYVGTLTGLNAAVQLHAPVAERSRILSLYTLALSVAFPIGSFVQGVLEHHVGVVPVTVGSAVFAGALLAYVSLAQPRFLDVMGAAAPA